MLASAQTSPSPRRLLITAGPTHEPIDAVRFIGNRSSGRLGIALAEAAAASGWTTTLLLGPVCTTPKSSTALSVHRFQSTADLEQLLHEHLSACDALIMAAAVADYRPRSPAEKSHDGKIKRQGAGLTLELEATPDLLASCAPRRRDDQTLVGFALEPRSRLLESAQSKVVRKRVDMIVANPLETMDAEGIQATLVYASAEPEPLEHMSKAAFASILLQRVARLIDARTKAARSSTSITSGAQRA